MLKRIRTREYQGWVQAGLDWTPSDPEGDEFQRMVAEKGELLLHCRGRDIYRINFILDGSPCSCFLYVFRNSSLSRAFKASPARRILKISRKIRELGFPSLEVLAALRPKKEMLNWNSLLIAKEIGHVKELPACGNHVYKVHESTEFSELVAELTARELARFHDSGLFHGDLKSRHVLVSVNRKKENPSIVFVDLEKTRHSPLLPSFIQDWLAARDLVQLLSSLPEEPEESGRCDHKSTFISSYLSKRNLPPGRALRIRKTVSLYLDSGSLHQGETVLRGVLRSLKSRFAV